MSSGLLYDEETGAPDREILAEAEKAEVSLDVELAQQVDRMASSKGFAQLRDWLLLQMDAATNKLVLTTTRELSDVIRLQETIKAYSSVLGFVMEKQNFLSEQRAQSATAGSSTDPAAR